MGLTCPQSLYHSKLELPALELAVRLQEPAEDDQESYAVGTGCIPSSSALSISWPQLLSNSSLSLPALANWGHRDGGR